MRKYLSLSTIIIALSSAFSALATAAEPQSQKFEARFGDSFAHMEENILTLGNDRIIRRYRWNEGHLISLDMTDVARAIVWTSADPQPDFNLTVGEFIPRDAGIESRNVAADGVRDAHLEITIKASSDTLESEKICRIYRATPALGCFYRFRASGQFKAEAGEATPLYHENVPFSNRHVQVKAVEFKANTDKNDTLVFTRSIMPYYNQAQPLSGNILAVRDKLLGGQIFVIKESPPSADQLNYPGYDFLVETGRIKVAGNHIAAKALDDGAWRESYPLIVGVAGPDEFHVLQAIRRYQDKSRLFVAERDDMIVMNTWGDRSQDGKIDEAFVMKELARASELGITHLQLDDGWQAGLSKNSVDESGTLWKSWEDDAWLPHPDRFPAGLAPVGEKARELGMGLGIWFNPGRVDDYANWQRDAGILIDLFKNYGVTVFKIDGTNITTLKAEENLRKLLKRVRTASGGTAVFNLDVTADIRPSYFYFYEYSNIFLENRYTDWGNYYPYRTLRNAWMLSRYMPVQRLQIEFLNVWRNEDKYPKESGINPADAGFDYAFAVAMAGQPLAWFEASSLPDEAFNSAELIKKYGALQGKFHAGQIFPVGEEPSGYGWTGFQSITSKSSGYLLVFRGNNEQGCQQLETWLPPSKQVHFKQKLGDGADFVAGADSAGTIEVCLPEAHSFALYSYSVE